jgi:hypothetical protein
VCEVATIYVMSSQGCHHPLWTSGGSAASTQSRALGWWMHDRPCHEELSLDSNYMKTWYLWAETVLPIHSNKFYVADLLKDFAGSSLGHWLNYLAPKLNIVCRYLRENQRIQSVLWISPLCNQSSHLF